MEGDSESGYNSSPEMVMEDNAVQLLRDCGASNTTEVAKVGPEVASFHGYKHYFQVVTEDSKNLRVRCTLCGGSKTLSSTRNTTSNFKKHLNAVHKNAKLVTKEVEKPDKKRQRSDTDDSKPKRQCTLTRNQIPAQKMQSLLFEYIIEDMQPLSTVESPAFQLINNICATQIPDRKSFTLHLDGVYDSMLSKIKQIFEKIDVVYTTVDAWTAHHRSYFGMTAHWIDPHTLNRHKAAIRCTRTSGRHTYDVLASKIEQAHASYSLAGKVCTVITDNGSNFVKAFTVFSDSTSANCTTEDVEEDGEDVAFENVDELLSLDPEGTNVDEDLTQVQFDLPPHYRCAVHTLNLVACKDVDKFLSSFTASKNVYGNSFAKSSALSNKASRSTVVSDTVQEVTKRKLIIPNATRWNSYYNAVVRVSENSLLELNELCTKLELHCLVSESSNF